MDNRNIKEYKLEGLDCNHCSTKIEDGLNSIDGVRAKIDFVSSKLTVKTNDDNLIKNQIEFLKSKVEKIEPGIILNDFKIDETKNENRKYILIELSLVGLSVIFLLIGFFILENIYFKLAFFVFSYLIVGNKVLKKAFLNIRKADFLDENFLMIIASVGAFLIGEYIESVAVMIFFKIGELLESLAVNRSKKSIKSLLDIKPDFANILEGNEIKKVRPETVNIGDLILVKPGEKIPLDGLVIKGKSNIDVSNINGESVPVRVERNDEIYSGSVNLTGLLTVKTTKSFKDSTVSKILDLVENSKNSKAKVESFITKFAKIYTPVVIVLTIFVAFILPLIVGDYNFKEWIHRSLIFLVISCPCALVISVPLCYFAGIGIASKYGILIKGGIYLESLSDVENVIFDKTGTLTVGDFSLDKIIKSKNISDEELIIHATYAEFYSGHPIGNVIVKYYNDNIKKDSTMFMDLIDHYEEFSGMGMKVEVNGMVILVGNAKLMHKFNIDFKELEVNGVVVYIAFEGEYEGALVLGDRLKKDSAKIVKELLKSKVKNIAMLTGDKESIAKEIASEVGIEKVFFNLLPDEKLQVLNKIKNGSKGNTVFVGDGTNDAPVLNSADIGISMGGIGTSAAIESSDIVLITDEPLKVLTSLKIAEFTKIIARENIFIAIFIKVFVMFLGVIGFANMWEAVFADVGVTLIVLINSIRIIKKKYEVEGNDEKNSK